MFIILLIDGKSVNNNKRGSLYNYYSFEEKNNNQIAFEIIVLDSTTCWIWSTCTDISESRANFQKQIYVHVHLFWKQFWNVFEI